jgi:RHS repeat-associated protein
MSGTLYYNDGTAVTISKVNNRLLPTQITDSNGNYIQIAYHWETNFPPMAINYIVDTLGRVISFNYGQWPAPSSTSLSSISTPAGTVTLNYQNVTMNYNYLLGNPVENAPASFYGISSATIPAKPTYSFSYSGYGMIYNLSAASAGGTATVTYDYPLGGEELIGTPMFTQRTESPNAVYAYGSDITRPDGTKLTLSSTLRELKSSSDASLSKTEYAFTTDPGGSPAIQSVISYDDATPTANQTKVDFDYDAYGNVVNKREYGFKINGAWQVRRRTHTTYVTTQAYLDAYMRSLPLIVEVYDSLGAQEVLIGKTSYAYDNYAAMAGMENYAGTASPPGHLSNYDTSKTTRGNLTGVTSYSDLGGSGVTRNSKLDIFGGITKAQVSCCNQKSFAMTEATYWSRASQTTTGDTSGIYLTSAAVYDFNTLAATSNTDPNNQTTTYSYDLAQRPTGFTSPTGANGSTSYNAWGDPTSSTTNYSESGSNKIITTSMVYDGWSQITSSIDANLAQTNYTYDNMGRLLTQTNPFVQGGAPGPVTTFQYDQQGRVTLLTLPGGNTVQTTYTGGDIVAVTDQVNRKIKREKDGLGRLVKVTEQDASTGGLTQETTYTYDAADRLIGVNQGGQMRAFKYDAQGRLLYERIPEQAASIWDGSTANWSTRYTYTDWGAMATRMDARGAIANFAYDSLRRLISVTYNVPSGVAATPSVTYTYENSQSSTTKGLLLSISVGTGYSESYSYDSFKRVQSVTRTIDGRNYVTSCEFNTINQTTRFTYPSGRIVNAGYDGSARLASLFGPSGTTYISSLSYDINGHGWILGNGVHEAVSFDANRLQPAVHTAGSSAPYTNLMNLAFSYQAAAGQMGAGTTAGNAGQLIGVSGTINGAPESATYTWDNLGRLITSNQASNGSAAQRRFTYDRWGNRTGVWDAVSGGGQIQSVTLEQSGGAPTNRIMSVNTTNYLYDTVGNVTNDGQHSYSYDAQNRLAAVDNGSTGIYAYDHLNRRVKKLVGTSLTHYVWEGGRVLAEHDGSSGAQIVDYVYANGKLIAKGSGTMPGSSTTYFVSDRMSVRVTMDASGNVIGRQAHLPFGEDFGESGTQEKHHFTTYERDSETGNDYAVNRGYSPSPGRFLSADPYGSSGSPEDPRSWNRYSYTRNVVINRGDPLGLQDGGIVGGCQPDASGSYPGKCLCIVVPAACGRRFEPPNEDGHSDGPGGGSGDEPFLRYLRVSWEKKSVDFNGMSQATLDLSGDACEGKMFEIRVIFKLTGAFEHSIPELKFIGDTDFKVVRRAGEDGSNGEQIEIIRLLRDKRGSGRGVLSIRIDGEKNGISWAARAQVQLRCSQTQPR